MNSKVCLAWLGFVVSIPTSALLGLELAFNVYALSLKQTFNFTQTEVRASTPPGKHGKHAVWLRLVAPYRSLCYQLHNFEMISASGLAGMGASMVEPFLTSWLGYRIGYLLIWAAISGSCFLMWVVVLYKDIFTSWAGVVCFIQFLMNAAQNAATSRLTSTSAQRLPKRHTGLAVGLGMASVAIGKLVYGVLCQAVYPNDLKSFFMAVFSLQSVSWGICFVIHRPDDTEDGAIDSRAELDETVPLNSNVLHSVSSKTRSDTLKIPSKNLQEFEADGVQNISAELHKTRVGNGYISPDSQLFTPDLRKAGADFDHFRGNSHNAQDNNIQQESRETHKSSENHVHHPWPDLVETNACAMIRSKYFHLTFWPSAVIYSVLYTYMNNITSIAHSLDLSEPMHTVYLMSITVAAGRLGFGLIFDKFKSMICGYAILLTGSLFTVTGVILVVVMLNNISIYIVTFFVGVGFSVALTIPITLMAICFGQRLIPYIFASMFCATAVFCSFLQFMVGYLYDRSLTRGGFCYGSDCYLWSSIVLLIIQVISSVVHLIVALLYKTSVL